MSEWDDAVDTVSDIAGVGAQFGGLVAAEYGLPEEAGEVIFGAAAGVGAVVGVGIEYATDHAISEGISDGLMGLVGEEESYAAASAFDDGDYLGGVGHMASGAWDTASEAGAETYEAVSDYAPRPTRRCRTTRRRPTTP